jgi:hypothetical protein
MEDISMSTALADVIEYDFDNESQRAATGPVPPGRFDVTVHDLIPKVSKAGNRYHQIVFEVVNGEYTTAVPAGTRPNADGAPESYPAGPAYIGARIYCNKPWMLGQLIKVTGFGTAGKVAVPRDQLLGYPVVVDLAGGMFNDKPTNEVLAIFDYEAVPVEVAAPVATGPKVVPPLEGVNADAELAF